MIINSEELKKALKSDFDLLLDDLQTYIDARVKEEVAKQLASTANVKEPSPIVSSDIPLTPVATSSNTRIDASIPTTKISSEAAPINGFGTTSRITRRTVARNNENFENMMDDFEVPSYTEAAEAFRPGFASMTPDNHISLNRGALSKPETKVSLPDPIDTVSEAKTLTAEPVPAASGNSPHTVPSVSTPINPVNSSCSLDKDELDFVQKYNNRNKMYTTKLSIIADIAEELSFKSTLSDWQELSESFKAHIVLDRSGSSTYRYVGDVSGNDYRKFYVAPLQPYAPAEDNMVRMALLAFFEYLPETHHFGEPLKLGKPAVFQKQENDTYICVEKGVIE